MRWISEAALACLVLAASLTEGAGLTAWVVTHTRRILRADPPGPTREARLAAARGEWEAFQVLVRSDRPVKGIRLVPGDLKGPGGSVIRAADARLYRQHQFHLTRPTYRNKNFRPGWYPDPLIPFRHPLTREPLAGGRFVAVPFDLPAGQTHGFFVDIYAPPGIPAGDYSGAYRLVATDSTSVEIPVKLTVWDFTLPAVPTLKTAFGSPARRMRAYYRWRARAGKEKEPTDWAAIEAQCAELLSRHRFNATPPPGTIAPQPQPDGSFRIPDDQIEAFKRFVERYHVNAFCVPHPRGVVKDPEKERAKLEAWLHSWDAVAAALGRPDFVFYTYLKDEPNDQEAYRYVQKWGRAVKRARSVVKVLVVEQTWPQEPTWGTLYGAVDIWCPLFSLFDPESAARRQALGETIWTYTALCQRRPTPWWHTDYPLLNYRVPAWIAWHYRIRGLLYWGGMSYWRGVEDPWTDPANYKHRGGKGPVFNGEGMLVYPGRAAGYEGIAPSLRLKALRDSIEDYEYLALAERAGRAAQGEKIIAPLVKSWFEWEKDPSAYERARARLAALIVGGR